MGLYLVPSAIHDSSVSLILYLDMVMVSPYFHVQRGDFFGVLHPTVVNPPKLSHRKNISGF